jgi:hypothetical protein
MASLLPENEDSLNEREDIMVCPYYRAVRVNAHSSGISGYCVAEPTWRLRVATLDEERSYCTTDQYAACPVFHARQAQIDSEEDVCISGK